jgi:hypothetical protein
MLSLQYLIARVTGDKHNNSLAEVSDIRTKSRRKFSIMLQQPLDSEEY